MQKRILTILICCVAILSAILVLLNRYYIKEYILQKLDERLDYERSVEVGDDFNKICWVDLKFQINHHKYGNNFEYVDVNNREIYILLKNISSYKLLNGKLYVKSTDGYAVIDEKNLCKIFTNYKPENGVNNCIIDVNNNKVYEHKRLQLNNVFYLSDYNEFTENEKSLFGKMLKQNWGVYMLLKKVELIYIP